MLINIVFLFKAHYLLGTPRMWIEFNLFHYFRLYEMDIQTRIALIRVFIQQITVQQSPYENITRRIIYARLHALLDHCLIWCKILPVNTSINFERYCQQLETLKEAVKKKRRHLMCLWSHNIHYQMIICLLYTSDAADE